MKVVINKCYGGFGLSREAVYYYAALKNIPLYVEPDKYGFDVYWTVPESERMKELADWSAASYEDRKNYNETNERQTLYPRDIERTDKYLVQTVETLGEAANGRYSSLRVVEIPDAVQFKIDEYDGMESIHEIHRSWE